MQQGLEMKSTQLVLYSQKILPMLKGLVNYYEEGYYKIKWHENKDFMVVSPNIRGWEEVWDTQEKCTLICTFKYEQRCIEMWICVISSKDYRKYDSLKKTTFAIINGENNIWAWICVLQY